MGPPIFKILAYNFLLILPHPFPIVAATSQLFATLLSPSQLLILLNSAQQVSIFFTSSHLSSTPSPLSNFHLHPQPQTANFLALAAGSSSQPIQNLGNLGNRVMIWRCHSNVSSKHPPKNHHVSLLIRMWACSLDLKRFCRGVGLLHKPLTMPKLNRIGIFSCLAWQATRG